ncbi:hypothetical protein [Archangium primigenium]|uniref:hypothetical protein n=1 Tax=[Archangium] primigenium TaxID=2792470 RepID=UPI001958E343|nr:hypothetical protein [Archangium primigenium]MBM7118872.1 hypothetical protein [Archangium primigenium]
MPNPPKTTERSSHTEAVRTWRETWSATPTRTELLDLFERALDGLWRRAHLSLGEITLMAIVDRVLHDGTERYPHLAVLKLETSGLNFGELRQSVQALAETLLEESLTFLLGELLRVLGTLTGEILTPALHAELHRVRPEEAKKGVKV